MMTISRLSAGDGYEYYTSCTARGDHRSKDQELGDYYLESGTPAGVWMGRGAARLGIEGEVTEAQMKALFGEGLHPEADRLIAEQIATGVPAKKAIEAVRLGRKFGGYQVPDTALKRAIDDAVMAEERRLGRELDADERLRVRMKTAGIAYREAHGRSGNRVEVAKWMSQELAAKQNTVAGFDLTFSAPKSLSVAWGIASPEQAEQLEQAHEAAIERTISWLEDEVIRARTGAQGIAFHATEGLLATRFRHWESREGDPQLHDHVVIANRVQITDAQGRIKWLTIDSRSLYKATVTASSVYNEALASELKQLGVELRERTTPSGDYRGMELAAISDELIEKCSGRRAAITARTEQLVAEFVAERGHEPDRKTRLALAQQATLETRVPKSQAITRDELRTQWRDHLGADAERIQTQIDAQLNAGADPALVTSESPGAGVVVEQVAADIVAELSARQSVWNRNHVATRVNMWAAAQPTLVSDELRLEVLDVALNQASISISPDVKTPALPELLNPDGSSIYSPPAARLYTSAQVLKAEDLLVDAAHDIHLPAVTPGVFDAVLAEQELQLDPGQIALARQVALNDQVLTVGIGPAGAGKTTAMRVAVEAVTRSGAQVHGVTVSAAAADQLQQATGMPSTTIAKWLHDHAQGRHQIRPGDVIVVDEAGMASATDLAAITRAARDAGAFVRLVGDDRQLQAIGAGGALKMLTGEADVVRLEQLHRFTDEQEAAASLRLRDQGDVEWHISQGRVHGGTAQAMHQAMVQAWNHDLQQGAQTLMMATTNHAVDALNLLAQQQRIDDGHVNTATTITLADGAEAGVGDWILTRRNDRRLTTGTGHSFVKNGDRWTIEQIHADGSIEVIDDHDRTCTLPADYVRQWSTLGYATTVHRAQGRTVDSSHLLLDTTSVGHDAVYVGLTRGRNNNQVWAITDGTTAPDMLRHAAATDTQASSARELIAQAQAEAEHPATLVRILADVQRRADAHRYNQVMRLEHPAVWVQIEQSPQLHRLHAALHDAETQGFSPSRILQECATNLPDGVTEPAGLIAWRIRRHLTLATEHAAKQGEITRRFSHLTDLELAAQLHSASIDKTDALSALKATKKTAWETDPVPATTKKGEQVPSWQHRPCGHLDDAELATRLRQARGRAEAASRAITEIRRHIRQLLRDPDAPASEQLLKNLDARLERLRNDRYEATRAATQLREETTTRHRLDGPSWHRETVQREAATMPERPGNLAGDVGRAELGFTAVQELKRQLWIESQRRRLDPHPVQVERFGAPAWAISGHGTDDPAMPSSWAAALSEMRHQVADAITTRGQALALDPPDWAATYLGPVPSPDDAARARWEQVAGQIETWRGLTDHTDPVTALPAPSRSKAVGAQAATWLHTLHAAASDLRVGRPIPTPDDSPGGGAEPSPTTPVPVLTAPTPTTSRSGVRRAASELARRIQPAATPTPTPRETPTETVPTPVPVLTPAAELERELLGATSRDRILDLTHQAAQFFKEHYVGSAAAAYTRERLGTDLTDRPEVVVGYAPGGSRLVQHLRRHGATDQELIDAGLAKPAQGGKGIIDVFRDRLVLGIHDLDGELVGFVGRARPDADPRAPKYLNTPTTRAFHKSEILFGLTEHQDLIKQGVDLVRVEGPLDALAITLGTQGKAVGVAPLGTALTEQQAQAIAAQGVRVWEATDTDAAGQKAAARDHELLIRHGVVARDFPLLPPDGRGVKDPAELLQRDGGAEALQMPLILQDAAPTVAGTLLVGMVAEHADHLPGNPALRVAVARQAAQLITNLPTEEHDYHTGLVAAAMSDADPAQHQAALRDLVAHEVNEAAATPAPSVPGVRIRPRAGERLQDLATHLGVATTPPHTPAVQAPQPASGAPLPADLLPPLHTAAITRPTQPVHPPHPVEQAQSVHPAQALQAVQTVPPHQPVQQPHPLQPVQPVQQPESLQDIITRWEVRQELTALAERLETLPERAALTMDLDAAQRARTQLHHTPGTPLLQVLTARADLDREIATLEDRLHDLNKPALQRSLERHQAVVEAQRAQAIDAQARAIAADRSRPLIDRIQELAALKRQTPESPTPPAPRRDRDAPER
ncbi:MAG: MobF family relaxase [Arachnia propionica]|uniref:MobF family relaxase n=1 Tax=Arachnia propionica TaxID=1750 RepID=UPI00270B8C23|nr:MobF family relaxase [Arachnia propionica]